MSGAYSGLTSELAQVAMTQFGAAFTSGLAQTLLIMAAFLIGVAIFILVGMPRGLRGSLITPPQTLAGTPEGRKQLRERPAGKSSFAHQRSSTLDHDTHLL